MKKSLAILLTLIFTFSCFSILGIGTVLAENQSAGTVLVESDFADTATTNWYISHNNVVFGNENGDDYARVTISEADTGSGLMSTPFNLIPGNEYELTYYIRIPSESISYIISGTNYAPSVLLYQPKVNEDGTKVTNYAKAATAESSNNYYAYKGSDWSRRTTFPMTWTIEGYSDITKTGGAGLTYQDQSSLFGTTDAKEVYANWTKVTAKFTAVAAADETSQLTAIAFAFAGYKKNVALKFDLKNVKLTCTKAVAAPEAPSAKIILKSDFTNVSSWVTNGQVESKTEDGTDFTRLTVADGVSAYLRSKTFNLTPGEKYTLTYYMRIPSTSANYSTVYSEPLSPDVSFYQPTKVGVGEIVPTTTKLSDSNLYAHSKFGRRGDLPFGWSVEGFSDTHTRIGFSDTGYNGSSVLYQFAGGSNASLNQVFANWKKVTVQFTAEAETEDSTDPTVAVLQLRVINGGNGLQVDIRDVSLVEGEATDNPVDPDDSEDPDAPVDLEATKVPYTPGEYNGPITVLDPNGNEFASGAEIGAKAVVKENADGTLSCSAEFDDMDGVNYFLGWFEGDTLVSSDLTFTAPATVNKDNLKAKFFCRSVITGGLGFEGYETSTLLRVSSADANQNLHNIAPYDDKWGQIGASYQQADDVLYDIKTVSGTLTTDSVIYNSDKGSFTPTTITVNPYSGNSMFSFAAPGRTVVRKLDNLKPNTSYKLSFYVYNPSECDYLKNALIADSHLVKNGSMNPSDDKTIKLYSAYSAKTVKKGNQYVLENEDQVNNWFKVTIQFATDENDTHLYLHLRNDYSVNIENSKYHKIFIDNLTCTEDLFDYAGNAIRANNEDKPQALRYKFFMDNKNVEGIADMTTAKVGLLVADSSVSAGEELLIGKTFVKDGREVKIIDATVNPETNFQTVDDDTSNTYFTAALYNIGKKGKSVDYNVYSNDYNVRPYIIYEYEDGTQITIYGDTISANVFDVTHAIISQSVDENDIKAARSVLNIKEAYDAYIEWQPTDGWYLGESKATDYAYSFAVVGDTQKTTGYYSDKLHYIYDWILENAESKKINYVIGLGDIVESNKATRDYEWYVATEQLERLTAAGLNQSIIRGNHDRVSYYDDHITVEKFGKDLDGYYNEMKNTYRRITIGGVKYLMLTLDLFATDDEVEWAENVIKANPDYNVVLTTHGYFNHGKNNYDLINRVDPTWTEEGTSEAAEISNSGQEIFDKLVNKYSNIVLVMCGHRYPTDHEPYMRETTRADGSKVVEMMINPQNMETEFGRSFGMLAMLYFSEDGKNVQLEYFSTISEMYYRDKYQFSFELDLVD